MKKYFLNNMGYIHNAEPLGWLDYIGMGVGVYGAFFTICLFVVFSPIICGTLLMGRIIHLVNTHWVNTYWTNIFRKK